jgi:hypothetical protein
MYEKNLRNAGHTRRFEIREAGGTWVAQTEHDSQVVKRVRYDDWHRVERTMLTFAIEISSLEQAGWVVAD